MVVTSCNGERFLGEQLRSIAGQTHLPDEVIVGDDASTDSSVEIAREVLGGLEADVRVVTSPSRLGLAANLARCTELSTGDVVFFADQDDVWRPGKVAAFCDVFSRDSGADLVFSNGKVIDGSGHATGRTLWSLVGFGRSEQRQWRKSPVGVLSRRTVVTGATMAVRRRLVRSAWPFPSRCLHDEWLTLCAALRGPVPVALPDLLVDYRLHGANLAGLPAQGARERLVQAGWPREVTLEVWDDACSRFPGEASAQLEAAICFARRRPARTAAGLERALRVTELGFAGDYRRYGQGWRGALHDLVAPALYGRGQG